ncbi:cobalamin biosynthesis protein [Aquamicrobium sp. LC103]|nr:cobalamin biosynthesis protein [Aquamicrobium sp. LC103]
MIVAGIGCRKNVAADAVLAAIDRALEDHGRSRQDLSALATGSIKKDEMAIAATAERLRLPLVLVEQAELETPRTITHSPKAVAATGVGSLSEAAALSAAGPESRLLGPRIILNDVACAIATSGDAS